MELSDTDRRLLLGLAALACLLPVAVALGPLQGIPHVSDEIAYTLQSRLLAAGARTGPGVDDPNLAAYPFWVPGPESHSPFPIGWPMLLAVGERLGVPWLVNPLLAALLPPLTFLTARAWSDDARLPRLAALLVAASPGVWLLAASRMSHTSVLVALAIALAAISTRRAWAAAGLALAYVVLARPFDGVLLGAPLVLWGLWRADTPTQRATLVLLPLLGVFGTLLDNYAITGDILRFPMNVYLDEMARPGCNRLGFGADVGCHATLGTIGHTPEKAAIFAGEAALRLDRMLLGLPGGLIAAAAGAVLLWRRAPLWIVPLVVLGYMLYWSPGRALGARFWHPLYLLLPALTAAGLLRLAGRAAPVLALAAIGVGSARLQPELADKLWCVDRTLSDALEAEGIGDGVVFLRAGGVRETGWPLLGVPLFRCTALLESGDAFLQTDPVSPNSGLRFRFALDDLDATRNYMRTHHPGAPAWVVRHDVNADTREIIPLGVLAP